MADGGSTLIEKKSRINDFPWRWRQRFGHNRSIAEK